MITLCARLSFDLLSGVPLIGKCAATYQLLLIGVSEGEIKRARSGFVGLPKLEGRIWLRS